MFEGIKEDNGALVLFKLLVHEGKQVVKGEEAESKRDEKSNNLS